MSGHAPTERPILVSDPMVRAILNGRKTQTRRVVNPQPIRQHHIRWVHDPPNSGWHVLTNYASTVRELRCPYGQVGDRLWVRETWCICAWGGTSDYVGIRFRAGGDREIREDKQSLALKAWRNHGMRWRPSIHMPRWASRLTLEVTSVRVERVQEISEEDSKAEGAMWHDGHGVGDSGWRHDYKDVFASARNSFVCLWNSINAKRGYGWDTNPWVWVVAFQRLGEKKQ